MAEGGYGPDLIRGFVERFGSIAKAEEKARSSAVFGEEIRKVEDRLRFLGGGLPHADPAAGMAKMAELRVLRRDLIVAALSEDRREGRVAFRRDRPVGSRKSARGRNIKPVYEVEANAAAKEYMGNRDLFRHRDDGGAYATHERYLRCRKDEGESELEPLSRPMVRLLIQALEEEWLPWDGATETLSISDDFLTKRTKPRMFVIPRSQTAS